MRVVVLDTNVASDFHKSQPPEWVERHTRGAWAFLTFITLAELAKWPVVCSWGEKRRKRLENWVAKFPIIPYDSSIAYIWGELAGGSKRIGWAAPQNDTWIAACCIRYEVPLLTHNTCDFQYFSDNHGLVLLGE